MLSLEERKKLLKQALSDISSDELYAELCSIKAAGPSIYQFFGDVPQYNLFYKSYHEPTILQPVTKVSVKQSYRSINLAFETCCNDTFYDSDDVVLAA